MSVEAVCKNQSLNIKNHNFILGPVDTDSISFSKQDGSPFTKEEQDLLLKEVNSLYPELIQFDHDGYFDVVICIRAKNYVLYDGKKIKYKGSALKSPTLEPALIEFIHEVVEAVIFDKKNYTNIYNKYVVEILNLKNMKRWCSRKTISSKTLESERTNEEKIRTAIQGTEYGEGDRVYVYFKSNEELSLLEHFDGDYHVDKLLEKLYKTACRFETILPIDDLFINYKLKKNKTKIKDINYMEMWNDTLK